MQSFTVQEVIGRYVKLSRTSLEALEQLAVREEYGKSSFLTQKGRQDNKEYLVLQGVCRSCIYSPEGDDVTLSFFVPGTVLSPYIIRTKEQTSIMNIQASTDLVVVSFDAKRFEEMMVNDLEVRMFGNEVLKRELAAMFEREISLASLTAKERLINFRKDFPMLENQIPHAEIASYLGITTISLSRLRKETMR